jgi:aryl carrier-like protein
MSDEKTLELPEGMAVEDAADVLGEYHTTDDAQIISEERLDGLESKVDELADVFRAALDEQTALSRETIDSMPVDALCNEFRNEDGELEPDTLNQSPETTTGESGSEDEGGDSDGDWLDSLSRSEADEIRRKIRKADSFEGRGVDSRADTLRAEAAEIAGTDKDEMEDLKLEAL